MRHETSENIRIAPISGVLTSSSKEPQPRIERVVTTADNPIRQLGMLGTVDSVLRDPQLTENAIKAAEQVMVGIYGTVLADDPISMAKFRAVNENTHKGIFEPQATTLDDGEMVTAEMVREQAVRQFRQLVTTAGMLSRGQRTAFPVYTPRP